METKIKANNVKHSTQYSYTAARRKHTNLLHSIPLNFKHCLDDLLCKHAVIVFIQDEGSLLQNNWLIFRKRRAWPTYKSGHVAANCHFKNLLGRYVRSKLSPCTTGTLPEAELGQAEWGSRPWCKWHMLHLSESRNILVTENKIIT
jgi:hypothetical protein